MQQAGGFFVAAFFMAESNGSSGDGLVAEDNRWRPSAPFPIR
jgi:hypothetical protein